MEGWSKKGKGLTVTDNSVVIARVGIRGLSGNGKNTIKNWSLKKIEIRN